MATKQDLLKIMNMADDVITCEPDSIPPWCKGMLLRIVPNSLSVLGYYTCTVDDRRTFFMTEQKRQWLLS